MEMKVSRVSEMRALDRQAMESCGISDALLMENAGQALYFAITAEAGPVQGQKFVVLCGAGNNGGDGLVVARRLHSCGGRVRIFMLGDPGKFKGAAQMNYEIVKHLGLPLQTITQLSQLEEDLRHCDLVIDAIFGTGLTREVGGLYREVIAAVNQYAPRVCSADIPSGIHGDSGAVMGIAVQADWTVTFGLPKLGNLLYPGYAHGGKLYVCHISFPPRLYEHLPVAINQPPELPARAPDGHKGTFGQVLFIAGAANYFGAPYFAARAFLKAGGGYARLAAPTTVTKVIAAQGSEIVFLPQTQTPGGSIALENKSALLEVAARMDMVVLGPGLSLDQQTQQLVRELTAAIDKPLLIDGDGLTALSDHLEIIGTRQAPTILTPHPGEMARITKHSVAQIAATRVDLIQETAHRLGAFVVLKGAHSLIGYPDQRVFINPTGNSGMATAGSGDVLTGTIAAMFGLGLPLPEAVRKGVLVHGLAGDLAAQEQGPDGVTAADILAYLPAALRHERHHPSQPLQPVYQLI